MEEKEGLNGGTLPKKLDSGMVEELQELLSPFQSGQKRPTAEPTSETHRLDEQKIRAALLVWLQRHYQSGELSLEEAAQLILCEREFPCASPEEESWAKELTADVLQHIARSRERKAKGKNPALCARVQVILERQFETITLKMAAEMVGVNSSYLSSGLEPRNPETLWRRSPCRWAIPRSTTFTVCFDDILGRRPRRCAP